MIVAAGRAPRRWSSSRLRRRTASSSAVARASAASYGQPISVQSFAARSHPPAVWGGYGCLAPQGGAAGMAEDERGGVCGFGPSALVELQAGAVDDHVEPPQIEAPLAAVLDPGREAVCERIRARARDRPGEVDVPSPRVLLEPRLFSELNAPLELLPALRRSYQQLHRADVVEHVDKDLTVVETLRNLHRARAPG